MPEPPPASAVASLLRYFPLAPAAQVFDAGHRRRTFRSDDAFMPFIGMCGCRAVLRNILRQLLLCQHKIDFVKVDVTELRPAHFSEREPEWPAGVQASSVEDELRDATRDMGVICLQVDRRLAGLTRNLLLGQWNSLFPPNRPGRKPIAR